MNIIIVGMGVVGRSLAEQLSNRNFNVCAIESDPDVCAEINEKFDVFAVNGSGSNPSLLKSAGVEKADMVIAVTSSDETNLLTCHFAKQFGVTKRVARVSSREYAHPASGVSLVELGVTHVVEPEREVVKSILSHIELPGATQTANFQADSVYLRGYRITDDMPLAGKALREIGGIPGYMPMRVVVIIRDRRAVLPTGDAKLLPGDEMIAVMPSASWPGFIALLNRQEAGLHKIVVFGDSLTAVHLVSAINPLFERVILVDPNEEHAGNTAGKLDGVEVLHGDCTDSDVLREIHAENVDFFIAASRDSEDNIISALLAKAEGAREVLAIHDDSRHKALFESLGLDHIISPKKITSDKIMENVHMLPLGRFFKLKDVDLDIMYLKTGRRSRIIGKPLRELDKLSRNAIVISAVVRDGRLVIPDGNTLINENDEVLVVCGREQHDMAQRLVEG